MPSYDYECSACDHSFEAFQSMSDDALVTCPACGKDTLKRLVGGGLGVIFRGSGFYVNDSRKPGSKSAPQKKSDTSSSEGSKNKASTDSKKATTAVES